MSFLLEIQPYTQIQCHIKENVNRKNYGNAFWDCDNKCHPKSPKIRSLLASHKASLTVFERPSEFEGLWHFLPPDHHWASTPMKTSRWVFGSNYAKAPLWWLQREVLILLKVVTKRRKRRQGGEYVNNLRKKEKSIFKWLLILIYN